MRLRDLLHSSGQSPGHSPWHAMFSAFSQHLLFSRKVWPEVLPLLVFRVSTKIIDLGSSVLGYICIAIAIGIAGEEIFTVKLKALQLPENISNNAIWVVMLVLILMSLANLLFDKLALYYAQRILSRSGQGLGLEAPAAEIIQNLETAVAPVLNFLDFLSELVFLSCILLVVLILSPPIFALFVLAMLLLVAIRKLLPASKAADPQGAYHSARLAVLDAVPPTGETEETEAAAEHAARVSKIHALADSRIELAMSSRKLSAKRTLLSSSIFIALVLVVLNVDINIESFSLALLFLLVIRQIGATIMNMLSYNRSFMESLAGSNETQKKA